MRLLRFDANAKLGSWQHFIVFTTGWIIGAAIVGLMLPGNDHFFIVFAVPGVLVALVVTIAARRLRSDRVTLTHHGENNE